MMPLLFDVIARGERWEVRAPGATAPRLVRNPLADHSFVHDLADLQEHLSTAVPLGGNEARHFEDKTGTIARRIGGILAATLLGDGAEAFARESSTTRWLHLRGIGNGRDDAEVDGLLSLPWELLSVGGEFPVMRGAWCVTREVLANTHPSDATPPRLKVLLHVSAPIDYADLDYEDESTRLGRSLNELGSKLESTDLGTLDDLIDGLRSVSPSVLHFSGHATEGQLLFEDEAGKALAVDAEELIRRARQAGPLPRLLFLASCHGLSLDRLGHPLTITRGPGGRPLRSSASTLHRRGVDLVLGYYGSIDDRMSTVFEFTLYSWLGEGRTPTESLGAGRRALGEVFEINGQRWRYPLCWAQPALYLRGPSAPFSIESSAGAEPLVPEQQVEFSTFIGRRTLFHELRWRRERKQQLFVLLGLPGSGKSALARRLLDRYARTSAQRLLLSLDRPRAGQKRDPIDELCAGVVAHGRAHRVSVSWERDVARIGRRYRDSAKRWGRLVNELRRACPGLVMVVDDLDVLQHSPDQKSSGRLGTWTIEGRGLWAAAERLSKHMPVLLCSRIRCRDMDAGCAIHVGPLTEPEMTRLARTKPGLARAPVEMVTQIVHLAAGHPGAVDVADDLLRRRGITSSVAFDSARDEVLNEIARALQLKDLWTRVSSPARALARALTALPAPVPRAVVDAMGSGADELISLGLLSRFSSFDRHSAAWGDRWAIHEVREWISRSSRHSRVTATMLENAGRAYLHWMTSSVANPSDEQIAMELLLRAGRGTLAWPLVQRKIIRLRDLGDRAGAEELLARARGSGLSDDALASALFLQVQLRRDGHRSPLDLVRDLEHARRAARSSAIRAAILHEEGDLFDLAGLHDRAEDRFRRAIALKRSRGSSSSSSLYALALALEKQGKLSEAVRYVRSALSVGGHTDLERSTMLHTLGDYLVLQGRAAEAESVLEESLQLTERAIGKHHVDYVKVVVSLAGIRLGRGDPAGASALLTPALEMLEADVAGAPVILGAVLLALGGAELQKGDFAAAERHSRYALMSTEGAAPMDDPENLAAQAMLAHALWEQGKPEAAEVAREALGRLDEVPLEYPGRQRLLSELRLFLTPKGPDDTLLTAVQRRIGALREAAEREMGEGRWDAAMPHIEEALPLARLLRRDRVVIPFLHLAAQNAIRRGDSTAAERFIDEGLGIARAMKDPVSVGTLEEARKLVGTAPEQFDLADRIREGNKALAEERWEGALEAFTRAVDLSVRLGERHHEAECRMKMVAACVALGRSEEAAAQFHQADELAMQLGMGGGRELFKKLFAPGP